MNRMWKNKIAILLLLCLCLCLISSCDKEKEAVISTENGGYPPAPEIDLSEGEIYYRYKNGKKQDGFIQLIGKNEWKLSGGGSGRFSKEGNVITFNSGGHISGRGVLREEGTLTITWTYYDPYTGLYQFRDESVLYKKG